MVALGSLGAGATSAAPIPGEIVFVSGRDGGQAIYSMDADGRRQVALTRPRPSGGQPAWSPDGRLLAFETDASVWTMRPDGTSLRRVTSGREPDWSPDGARLAVVSGSERELLVVPAGGGSTRRLLRTRAGEAVSSPSWSPDGRLLAYAVKTQGRGGRLETLRLDGTHRTVVARLSAWGLYFTGDPDWDRSGRIVFADTPRLGEDSDLFTIDPRTRVRRHLTVTPGIGETQPAWSPDGQAVAFLLDDYDDANGPAAGIYMMRVRGAGAQVRVIADQEHTYWAPAWSPEGQRLAVEAGNPDNTSSIVITRLNGRDRVRLLGGRAHGSPTWTPDGRAATFVDAFSGVYRIRALPGRLSRINGADCWAALSWSPGGRRLACELLGEGVQVLSVATGRSTTLFPDTGAGDEAGTSPAWSPDGRSLAYVEGCSLRLHTFSDGRSRVIPTPQGCPTSPAWSPDGRRLAVDIGSSLFTLRTDGTEARRIARGSNPAWSPDGRWIAFDSERTGNLDVYIVASDGSHQRRLTTHPGRDADPSWRPR